MEAAANIRIPFSGWSYVRPLGSGGFGSVCEIQRDLLGTTEKSAMKIISIPKDPSAIDADRSDGYDEVSIRRKYEDCLNDIVAEYKLMQQLQGNSNIVDCKDIYYERQGNGIGWNVYVRMELLTPLKDLTNAGDLPEETVIELGKDICRALAACQERNIVHRDIKPENIMASSFGFKLGDFGIARTLDHTTNASLTGTERYIAPEVWKREKYGREVDIYSLGLVLYWLLNNRRMPFWPQGNTPPRASEIDDAQAKRIHGVPLPAPVHGSPALKQIVLKACAYKPKDRYSSAKEMLTALEGLTNGTMPTAEHSAAAASAGGSFGSSFGGATIGGEYGRNSIGTDPVYGRSFGSESQSTAGNGWRNGETIGDPNLRKQNQGPSGPAEGCDETVGKVLSAGGGNSDQQQITVRMTGILYDKTKDLDKTKAYGDRKNPIEIKVTTDELLTQSKKTIQLPEILVPTGLKIGSQYIPNGSQPMRQTIMTAIPLQVHHREILEITAYHDGVERSVFAYVEMIPSNYKPASKGKKLGAVLLNELFCIAGLAISIGVIFPLVPVVGAVLFLVLGPAALIALFSGGFVDVRARNKAIKEFEQKHAGKL